MQVKRSALIALAGLTALACSKNKDDELTIPLEPVTRQTIVVQAEATGVVEPINIIEVKAKSSGQIVAMPVETGTFVKPGDLIVQLDTRDTRNAYAQAKADLDAANVNLRVAKQASDRAEQLYKERIITEVERESAQVQYANAQSTVLRNRAALDIRAQFLDEATVRAPVAGTVIEKPVALGQVIASGTSGLSGGTTIIKMADLTKVRVRALVNETDIGKIKPGLQATVTVDAFPDRPFIGTVEKIEPQATIQQSVTMFPVLVSIDNQARLLMPGMNGEVSIEVERRENVLAVSNDAVRSPNEVAAVAPLLGLDPDSVRAELRNQGGQRGGQRVGSTQGLGGQSAAGTDGENAGRAELTSTAAAQQSGQRGGFNLPEVTDKQCETVTATIAKHPDVPGKIAALRTRVQSGELDRQAMQAEMQKIYSAIGVDPAIARACTFRQRGAGGAVAGGRGAGGAGGATGNRAGAPQGAPTAPGGAGSVGGAAAQGSFGGGTAGGFGRGQAGGRRGLVFVAKDKKYSPRMVRLGVSNFDYSEVLSGLQEGEQVAILNVAVLQARQQENMNQVRGRAGVPGMQRQPTTGTGGAGGAGGTSGAGGAGARGGAGGAGGQRGGGGG
jgi:HlyD family secretion protein